MRLSFAAAVLGLVIFAGSPGMAKNLPAKTSLPEVVAFVAKTAGEPRNASEQFGRYTMTVGDAVSVGFSEDSADNRDVDEIMQFVLRTTSQSCSVFRPTAFGREELGSVTLVRVGVRCVLNGAELHGEELIIADADRYQNFSVGGPVENRDTIAGIATTMFDALLATYR